MSIDRRTELRRHPRIKNVDGIVGEPLSGSGFEDETPDPEFRDAERDAAPLPHGSALSEGRALAVAAGAGA
jgi:hypothetical protein